MKISTGMLSLCLEWKDKTTILAMLRPSMATLKTSIGMLRPNTGVLIRKPAKNKGHFSIAMQKTSTGVL